MTGRRRLGREEAGPAPQVPVSFRVHPDDGQRMKRAADRVGESKSGFIRKAALDRADRVLGKNGRVA